MTDSPRLPPGQQLAARNKWPQVGEPTPPSGPDPWRLDVGGLVARPATFTLADLERLPRCEPAIDLHCVTRWTKLGVRFVGVALADVLQACEVAAAARFVRFVSFSPRSHDTSLPLDEALRLRTLLAWQADGEPISADHGGPVRVIVPERYLYKSLKWLRSIELLERDRLGFWEREAGYHNEADPWREQRYLAPTLTRMQVRAALKSKNFAGQELRSMDCRGHDLSGLQAERAILRDVDFRDCPLVGSSFVEANLTNARFSGADLCGSSFRNADLEGADFGGCDLGGCDFRGPSLFGASFRPASVERPTRVDAATQFDTVSLERLMPEEEAFLRGLLRLR